MSPIWLKKLVMQIAFVDKYLRGDRWRPVIGLAYKLMAPSYDRGIQTLLSDYDDVIREWLKYMGVNPNDYILDLGCGTGAVTFPAASMGAFVTGLDRSSEMLAKLEKQANDHDVLGIQGDARFLPFRDQTFNVGVTSFMMLHLTRDEKQQVLQEMWRVLKTEGRVGFLTSRDEISGLYISCGRMESVITDSALCRCRGERYARGLSPRNSAQIQSHVSVASDAKILLMRNRNP